MARSHLIVIAALSVFVTLASGCANDPDTPGNAVVWYFEDVREGDHEAARDRLCEDLKREVSMEDFESGEVDALLPINPFSSLRLIELDERDERSSATRDVEVSNGDHRERWAISLVKEGEWKLCGFEQLP